jgi:hypothetical protein
MSASILAPTKSHDAAAWKTQNGIVAYINATVVEDNIDIAFDRL